MLIWCMACPVICFSEGFRFNLHEDLTTTQERPYLVQLRNDTTPIIDVAYSDVFDTQRYQSLQGHQAAAHTQSGQLVFSAATHLPPIRPYVTQSIPDLWRVVVPSGWSHLEDPVVVHWHSQMPEDQIKLQVQVEPWVQRRFKRPDGVEMIEGGAYVRIAIESLQAVQQYPGQLFIDLQEH